MWLLKVAQMSLEDEFLQRKQSAYNAENEIRNKTPRRAQTYYESIVEDANIDRAAIQPWREFVAWMESVAPQVQQSNNPQFVTLFNQYLEIYRDRLNRSIEEPNQADFEGWLDEDVAEFYLNGGDWPRLQALLDQNDVPYEGVTSPSGKRLIVIEMGDDLWVVEQDGESLTYWKDANEWIDHAAEWPEEYFGERDATQEFWDGVGPGDYLYHATREENVESILQNGLEAREDTRGMGNQSMGPAVFTISGENSDDLYAALESYGGVIIRIDLASMKADGFMPDVSGETPLEEAEIKDSLAHLIGYENYHAYGDVSSDYMTDTIAVFSGIPPKYLSVLDR